MRTGPTKRDMQILAAWWFAHGNYDKAAAALKIGRQPVKNALYRFRREEKVESNLELAMRYQAEITKLRRKPLNRPARHGEAA